MNYTKYNKIVKQSKSHQKNGIKDFYFPIVNKNSSTFNLPQDQLLHHSARKIQSNKSVIQNPQMKRHSSQIKNNGKKSQIKRNPQNQLKMNNSALYFTKRVKQQNQKRQIQLKQKKQFLLKDLLQKRQEFQNFKLQKQRLMNQQKQKIIQDIYIKHSQRQRQKSLQKQKNQRQKQFIHTCNLDKINMQRKLKFQIKQEDIMVNRQKYVQTQHHSSFLRKEYFKNRNKHMKLLESRLVFLLSEKIPQQRQQDFLKQKMTSRSFYGQLPKQMENQSSIY